LYAFSAISIPPEIKPPTPGINYTAVFIGFQTLPTTPLIPPQTFLPNAFAFSKNG
jgi:hypothetical protein